VIVRLASGCNIIFEEDLSKEVILVNMPVDGTISSDTSQLFWWEMLDGALAYNLQIVAGSFDNPLYLLVDTNAVGNKFLHNILPGEYQWRISGWNNSSETEYGYHLLTITDSTIDEE
jgi:hypothetical protein